MPRLLILEPFYGGSHQCLVEALTSKLHESDYCLVTLPDKKWHWRARTAALSMSQSIPKHQKFTTLFTSSVLSLSELIGLRPDLAGLKKIVYFHESQLEYPVRKVKERDFQYGYNQITTCLAADIVIFNSNTLRNSFLGDINKFLRIQPDYRPNIESIVTEIERKSRTIYFPLSLPKPSEAKDVPVVGPVHIVWPHRWEHDKDPDTFFRVLFFLQEEGLDFRVSVIGQTYDIIPDIFEEAKVRLAEKIVVFGFKKNKIEFYQALEQCHVVVSTARHETYGVAMLEATALGCFPLVPNRLVYPELYPSDCLYNTEQQLYKRLRGFCLQPSLLTDRPDMKFERFSGQKPLQQLIECLKIDQQSDDGVSYADMD